MEISKHNVIYKNSQKEDTENHRPAMLTSVPGKGMEHIIFDTNSYSILLKKLADHGLDLYWVKNWPDVQRVVGNGVTSSGNQSLMGHWLLLNARDLTWHSVTQQQLGCRALPCPCHQPGFLTGICSDYYTHSFD